MPMSFVPTVPTQSHTAKSAFTPYRRALTQATVPDRELYTRGFCLDSPKTVLMAMERLGLAEKNGDTSCLGEIETAADAVRYAAPHVLNKSLEALDSKAKWGEFEIPSPADDEQALKTQALLGQKLESAITDQKLGLNRLERVIRALINGGFFPDKALNSALDKVEQSQAILNTIA